MLSNTVDPYKSELKTAKTKKCKKFINLKPYKKHQKFCTSESQNQQFVIPSEKDLSF